MTEPLEMLLIGGVLAIMLFWLLYIIDKTARKEAYLKGQSDCLQGDIKITLVQFKDGERKWYYTNELKDLEEHTIVTP